MEITKTDDRKLAETSETTMKLTIGNENKRPESNYRGLTGENGLASKI